MAINDSQHRKYQLTLNNPLEKDPPYDHLKIKEELTKLTTVTYWCLADEIGEQGTPHTHIYIESKSPIAFKTILNRFPSSVAHIEPAYGNCNENRAYIRKEGKKHQDKNHTSVEGTFEEWGTPTPQTKLFGRNQIPCIILELIDQGASDAEIIRIAPESFNNFPMIDKIRQCLKEDQYKRIFRKLEVKYVFGETNTYKTRTIMESLGDYSQVFRITDYTHPFDSYKNQNIIVFEEFRSSLRLSEMLNYCDGYPCDLKARYANKQACFEKVYIVSNIPLEEQFINEQRSDRTSWDAFLRRINTVVYHYFDKTGELRIYELDRKSYTNYDDLLTAIEVLGDGVQLKIDTTPHTLNQENVGDQK